MIDMERRKALKTGGGIGLLGVFTILGLLPRMALADMSREAFGAKNLSEAFEALGALIPEDGTFIKLTAPDVAENGAVVPVTIESTLNGTEQIFVLVDKNPTMLAARFVIPEGTEGFVTTRIKMAQTSSVIALVKANGMFYRASKEVKVTVGGC